MHLFFCRFFFFFFKGQMWEGFVTLMIHVSYKLQYDLKMIAAALTHNTQYKE